MLRMYDIITRVAPTKAPVLIIGETGTGKELVAKAIHKHSARKEQPFVAINCSALTDSLWESEMFGHEKGAFTGAVATKKGRFEMADTGTLFLDEVSEMSLGLQRKFLRALQEMAFERVGGANTIKVDVRYISAANRDPHRGVEEGWFRQDLYYRLNVIRIHVPTLRERKEDIPPLVQHFVTKYAQENGKKMRKISHEALQSLVTYSFPGNIRELENIIQRAVILAKSDVIHVQDLPEELMDRCEAAQVKRSFLVKRNALLKALENAAVFNNGGPPRLWCRTLRSVNIETIYEFLLEQNTRPFSRYEFAQFLRNRDRLDRNKYGTAGKYLSILKKNHICVHNKKKANRSKYKLSAAFLM